jgi:hypothetical protein
MGEVFVEYSRCSYNGTGQRAATSFIYSTYQHRFLVRAFDGVGIPEFGGGDKGEGEDQASGT